MKKNFFSIFFLIISLSLCGAQSAKVKLDSAQAKKKFGTEFSVTPMDKTVTISRNKIIISPAQEGLTYTISGYFNGQVINRTKNTVIKLDNAYLENKNGEPALFGEAKTEVSAAKDSENWIVSSGKSDSKTATIQCKKNLVIGGSGILYVAGNVFHGVKADDVKVKGSGTLYFQGSKKGAALNCTSLTVENDKTFKAYFVNSKNGIKADSTITINSGNFYFYNNETALKTDTKKDNPKQEHSITLAGGIFHTYGNANLFQTEKNACKTDGAKFIED